MARVTLSTVAMELQNLIEKNPRVLTLPLKEAVYAAQILKQYEMLQQYIILVLIACDANHNNCLVT